MLTRENYQHYLLDSYKALNDILVKGDLDEVKKALPAGVTIIMSQVHMITPLSVAIFHNHQHIIQFLLEHESSNLSFYPELYNPFHLVLERCAVDKDNRANIQTLLLFLKHKPIVLNDFLNNLNLNGALAELIVLVKAYYTELKPSLKIWYEYEIAKKCEINFNDYNEHIHWYTCFDQNLLNYINWNADDFYTAIIRDKYFYQAVIDRVNRINPNNIQEYANLFSAYMILGRVHLEKNISFIPYNYLEAIKYFLLASHLASANKIDVPAASKDLFLALHSQEAFFDSDSNKNQEKNFSYALALAQPAKNGSIEALLLLKDLVKFSSNSLKSYELMACYIYNAHAKDRIFENKMLSYQYIIEGLAYYYGVYRSVDYILAYLAFKTAADNTVSSDQDASLFACNWAILSLNHSQAIKSKQSSEIVVKAVAIFDIMLNLKHGNANDTLIKARYNAILSFANRSELPADKSLIHHSCIQYFQLINNYFIGRGTTDWVEKRKAVLHDFLTQMSSSKFNFYNDAKCYEEYVVAITEICSPLLDRDSMNLCFEELAILIAIIKKYNDDSLVVSTIIKVLDAYYACLTLLSDSQLDTAIRCLEMLVPILNKNGLKIELRKYSLFYIDFSERIAADQDERFDAYTKAVALGNRDVIVNILEIFENTSVEYQRKTACLNNVLKVSLYPDSRKFMDLFGGCITNHIKNHPAYVEPENTFTMVLNSLGLISQNVPDDIRPLSDLFNLAKRCIDADNNTKKLIGLVKEDYFPAFIKLTMLYISRKKIISALYCSTRLAAELILNRAILAEKYNLTSEVLDQTILKARGFITHCLAHKQQSNIAAWCYGFLNFIDDLTIHLNRPSIILRNNIDDENQENDDLDNEVKSSSAADHHQQPEIPYLDVESLLVINSENARLLHVYSNITAKALKTSSKNLSQIQHTFLQLRKQYGDCLLYETEKDTQYYENLHEKGFIELKTIAKLADSALDDEQAVAADQPTPISIQACISTNASGLIFFKLPANKAYYPELSPQEQKDSEELFESVKEKVITQHNHLFLFDKPPVRSVRPMVDIMDYVASAKLKPVDLRDANIAFPRPK